MKNLLLFAIITAAVFVNSGCSSKLMSFEKRRYNQGYHVDFAAKKDKRASVTTAANFRAIPKQEAKEIITASTQNTFTEVPALNAGNSVSEETKPVASAAVTVIKEKNKFFTGNPILKHFTGSKTKVVAKRSLDKLFFKKNTAGTGKTARFNFFTFLGAVIAGGCGVALVVMLFSNWGSTTFLIVFVSGIFFGLILLIIGANT